MEFYFIRETKMQFFQKSLSNLFFCVLKQPIVEYNNPTYQYEWKQQLHRHYRQYTEPMISSWCASMSEKMGFELKST